MRVGNLNAADNMHVHEQVRPAEKQRVQHEDEKSALPGHIPRELQVLCQA
jgi:hypothetical protein